MIPVTPPTAPPPPRGGSGRRRSVARLAAVQALYQLELTEIPPWSAEVDKVVRDFARHRLGHENEGDDLGEADPALFADLVKGTCEHQEEIDRMLSSALSEEWPLRRLEAILRAILRAGAYELLARRDVPARVVISEYLDVAHAFFAGKEPGLVNGVLDRLARKLREEEMGRDRLG
jgi:N utilization substance protein B